MAVSNDDFEATWPEVAFSTPLPPRYNIAPSQDVPAILNVAPTRVTNIRWGLIPAWAKDAAISRRMINARAESVHEKSSFMRPFERQRCLFLADGFYEWKKVLGQQNKVPHHIRLKSGRPFAFAGLWDRWITPDGDELISGTIITTTPNPLMEPIHNRMPVILPGDVCDTWLSDQDRPATNLLPLLAPFPADAMEAWPVSSRVNNPGHDQPDCRTRIDSQMDLI